jgi:hypothetical protein
MTNDDAATLAAYRSDPVQARYQSWEAPYPVDSARALITEMRDMRFAQPGAWLQIVADDIWEDSVLVNDVVALIARSKVVICDLTGRNANVFYEAGIAHTLGREVVLITQSADDVPFDLRHHRYITYLGNFEGLVVLKEALIGRLRTLMTR